MYLEAPQLCEPSVEDAIDRHPLIVTPDTALLDVIDLMGQRRSRTCALTPSHGSALAKANSTSCAIIQQDNQVLGILTERDIVRLAATRIQDQPLPVSDFMASPVVTLVEDDFQDVFSALFLFRRYKIRHLVIVDEHQQLRGVVSQDSLRQLVRPANLLKMRRVSDVMTTPVIHAFESTSILDLAQQMTEHRVSCVVIIEEDEEYDLRNIGLIPVGIITERDIVQFQSLRLDMAKIQARDVMSAPLFLLNPGDSLLMAYEEMQRRRVRRLVVSWDWGKGLGILTQTSLLKIFDPMEMYSVIDSLQQTVQELEEEVERLKQG